MMYALLAVMFTMYVVGVVIVDEMLQNFQRCSVHMLSVHVSRF